MPPSRLVTRIAPTPSGFLHVGNAVNMLLAAWWAAAGGGALVLRIDDFDTGRVRREYLSDVFDTLDWLGIAVDAGPRDPQDFEDRWSMTHRRHQFRTAIERLLAERPDSAFVCRVLAPSAEPRGVLRRRVPVGSASGPPRGERGPSARGRGHRGSRGPRHPAAAGPAG